MAQCRYERKIKKFRKVSPRRKIFMIPGHGTIKDIVRNAIYGGGCEDVFADFMAKPALIKNDKGFVLLPVETAKKRCGRGQKVNQLKNFSKE